MWKKILRIIYSSAVQLTAELKNSHLEPIEFTDIHWRTVSMCTFFAAPHISHAGSLDSGLGVDPRSNNTRTRIGWFTSAQWRRRLDYRKKTNVKTKKKDQVYQHCINRTHCV